MLKLIKYVKLRSSYFVIIESTWFYSYFYELELDLPPSSSYYMFKYEFQIRINYVKYQQLDLYIISVYIICLLFYLLCFEQINSILYNCVLIIYCTSVDNKYGQSEKNFELLFKR